MTTDPFVPPDGDTSEPKWVTAADRQETRLASQPVLYRSPHERLAVELALGMGSPEDIFKNYGYTAAEAIDLMATPSFTALLARVGAEVKESGLSFRTKAKAISEELLAHGFDIATDPLQSAATRASLIQWFAKVSGYEPGPNKGDAGSNAGGFTLSISFAGQAPQQVIAGREPITIDQQ